MRYNVRGGGEYLFNLPPGEHAPLKEQLTLSHFEGDSRYRRFGVHDDGSCFFHTICAACNIQGYRSKTHQDKAQIGRKFRKKIRNKISKQNWDTIWSKRGVTKSGTRLPEVETIKEMLSDHKTWADVYIILYVMDKMNLNMLFFDLNSNSIYCGVRGIQSDHQNSVLVAWINKAHFEPIYRTKSDNDSTDTFMYSSDDAFIRKLMKSYHSKHCVINNDVRDIL